MSFSALIQINITRHARRVCDRPKIDHTPANAPGTLPLVTLGPRHHVDVPSLPLLDVGPRGDVALKASSEQRLLRGSDICDLGVVAVLHPALLAGAKVALALAVDVGLEARQILGSRAAHIGASGSNCSKPSGRYFHKNHRSISFPFWEWLGAEICPLH